MPRFTKETPTAFQNMTEEKQRSVARQGGKASGEAKKRYKTMEACMKYLLSCEATDDEKDNVKKLFPDIDVDMIDKNLVLCSRQLQKGISKGDTTAANFVRDTSGQKPSDTVTLSGNSNVMYITPEMDRKTREHIEEMIKQDE